MVSCMTTNRQELDHPHSTSLETCEDHLWSAESRHATSEGTVLYERCRRCGARRLGLLPAPSAVAVPLSGVLGLTRARGVSE